LGEFCRKINGTLSVPLSTKKLGGGMQKVLTLVESSQEESREVDIIRVIF
jgi:hypothetical protein